MLLTCAQSLKASKPALLAAALGLALTISFTTDANAARKSSGSAIEAPVSGAVTVSDYEFNTFVFGDTIKRIFFPAGSPVVGKPVYLADNTQVMLQFGKGHTKPIQMVVELESGRVESIRVAPKNVPGVTHSPSGAAPRKAVSAQPRAMKGEGGQAAAPRGEDIELLKQVVVSQEPPSGFDPIKLPKPTRFDKFTVVPLAGWSDGGSKRILVFSLVAVPGQTAVVAPPQFYRDGITAVMLDGDVVDDKNSPQLFVVEETNDE